MRASLSQKKSLSQKLGIFFGKLKKKANFLNFKEFLRKWPFAGFFLALALLLAVILIGSYFFKPQVLDEKQATDIREVEVFKIGAAPKLSFQAQVEKTGVIKIVSQNSGIVSWIGVAEGDVVQKGKTILSLASNYSGANAFSVSRQIAQTQYDLTNQNYDAQKEIIKKQKNTAEKTQQNSDQLRDISNRSIDESRSLLDLNEGLVSKLDSDLSQYEATNSGDVNRNLIFQTQQLKSQYQGIVNGLRTSLRSLEFSSGSDKPPAELANLQREITLKQLDVQEKSLDVSLELSKLQLQLAQITEASMYPQAPFGGTIERIHVRIGQSVNPGTLLVTLSGTSDRINVVAKVPQNVAQTISLLEESEIMVGDKVIKSLPSYVSHEATDGNLYDVIFQLDDSYRNLFTDGAFVKVNIPIGVAQTSSTDPFVPIDAVYQTQDEAYLYVVDGDKAKVKKVSLGQVQGRFVEVLEGLSQNDDVIVDRVVIEGDKIKIKT